MNVELITKNDLEQVKTQIVSELKTLLSEGNSPKKWLTSKDVKKIFGCSDTTLQTMRVKGIIKYSSVMGRKYYRQEDVMEVFEKNMSKRGGIS